MRRDYKFSITPRTFDELHLSTLFTQRKSNAKSLIVIRDNLQKMCEHEYYRKCVLKAWKASMSLYVDDCSLHWIINLCEERAKCNISW